MPQVEVCYTPQAYPLFHNEEAIVVVIDVLRATSAIVTAFFNGVDKMIPVAGIEEALAYKSQGFLVAAERNGEMVSGFEFGNSPFGYMNKKIKGKTIAITTTNGTQAIEAAKVASKIVIGSFLNLDLLSDYLVQQKKDVIMLCAGWKNKFNLEDTLCAGAICQRLHDSGKFTVNCDSALASMHLYELAQSNLYGFLEKSSHRQRLAKLDLERDIQYCLTLNQCPVIPILKGRFLEKLS